MVSLKWFPGQRDIEGKYKEDELARQDITKQIPFDKVRMKLQPATNPGSLGRNEISGSHEICTA